MTLPRRAWVVIAVMAIAGLGAMVVANVVWADQPLGDARQWGPLAVLYGLYWGYPVLVLRHEETEAVHVDEAFFVVTALVVSPRSTALLFAMVPLAVLVLQRRPWPKVLFNTGQMMLAAVAGASIDHLLVGDGLAGTVGPTHVLAAVAGAFVFWAVNSAAVALIISVTDEPDFFRAWLDTLSFNGLVFIATTSLGVLAGVAGAAFGWALLVATVPLAVLQIVFASALRIRGERERIDGLLRAALDAHRVTREPDVEQALLDAATSLLQCRTGRVGVSPPGDGELGAVLPGLSDRWLVVGGKRGVEGFGPADTRLLDAIVTVGSGALENARLIDQMHHQAFHDGLTGLPNRLLFEDRLAVAIEQARRDDQIVGVLFVDLDRFKKVNDSLGHTAGNELLCQTAHRLARSVRAGDTVARIGGDEFVVLLAGLTNHGEANRIARVLLDVFDEPFQLDHHELFVTPSIGVASYPRDGSEPAVLLKHADMAMYRAKEQGRNTMATYTDGMDSSAYSRLTLEANLHNAVDREELELRYQPQVDIATGRIVGVEALVRWPHPTLGMVSPAQFIPLAEETGLIRPIDAWVLRTACRQAQAWAEQGLPPLKVAVNLSGHDFRHPRLVESIADVLAATGMAPSQLEIEVTESVAVDFGDTSDTFSRLKELGCRLAIDDFGTGYSMLSRLQRFPLDKLKIDKSFIDDIGRRDGGAPIVEALIGMAHGLGLEVCAEGVEKAEQWEYLDRHRCDLVQGFYFAKPSTADEVAALVRGRVAGVGS